VGLPTNVKHVDFRDCHRLRRIKRSKWSKWWYLYDDTFDPAQDVHTLMVSGLSDKLLSAQVSIGPDAALLIAQFVTSGMSANTDRMETMQQVRARYGLKG